MGKEWLLALCIGYGIDLAVGDPHGIWHPVQGIGWLINVLERPLRRIFPKSRHGEIMAGAALAVLVPAISVGISFGILAAGRRLHPYVGFGLSCLFCGQLLATKSLKTESMKVYRELKEGNLKGARQAVSMIVGRDTKGLSKEGIAKAAVETIAENTSDGSIAPMMYMALFGPLGGFFYKAVNTLDSMVGYKNEKYLYFGRASAKLDDILNYIPARISGGLMIWAAFCAGLDWKNAWRIFWRDRFHHASPNSAQTEAACAGALGVQLAGDAYYLGVLYKKKTIGDKEREVTFEDIKTANRLLYIAGHTGIAVIAAVCLCLWLSL